MKKLIIIFITLTTILTLSCKKSKLTNSLCDCASTETVELIDTISLLIPNIITPNGDGVNDFWILGNKNYFTDVAVKITDKGGVFNKIVFESSDYMNDWGGLFKEKLLSDGEYFYEIIIGSKTISGYVCIYGTDKVEPENTDCLHDCKPTDPNDYLLN